jgi:hypothetical protein
MYQYTREQLEKSDFTLRYLSYVVKKACPNVKGIGYEATEHSEIVTLTFKNGTERKVNVTADSLLALARDVLNKL